MELQSETKSKATKKTGGKGKKGKNSDESTQEDSVQQPVKEIEPESEPEPEPEINAEQSSEKKNDEIEGQDILNKLSEEDIMKNLSDFRGVVEKISAFTKTMKDIELTKDILKEIVVVDKELKKAIPNFSNTLTEILVKECNSSIKAKNTKKTKKEKSSVNKENYAVNKKSRPLSFVAKFMEIDEDSEISPGELLKGVNAYIKTEKKIKKTPEIFVEGNNSMFKVYGKLKTFFDSVHKEMKSRNDPLGNEPFPTELRYKDLMKYNKYCFPPKEKK